jgi:hypothetical protein
MSETTLLQPTSLCRYDECRYCVYRVNTRRTPGGSGECELVLQSRVSVSLCRGRRFFRLAPERAAEYRGWVLSGAGRTPVSGPTGDD